MLSEDEFFDEQERLADALAMRLLDTVPPEWEQAWLEVSPGPAGPLAESFKVQIRGPDGSDIAVFAAPELREIARNYFRLFERQEQPIRGVSLHMFRSETGGWRYEANLEY